MKKKEDQNIQELIQTELIKQFDVERDDLRYDAKMHKKFNKKIEKHLTKREKSQCHIKYRRPDLCRTAEL